MADPVLGIDVGTTSVKAAALSPSGAMLSRFAQTHPTERPAAGLAEQDPDTWMRHILAALECFSGEGLRPGALGLTSQVGTHVFVDAGGRPLLPAMLWQDGRASAEAAELDAQVTATQKTRWFGAPMPIDASHALPRMLWLARHHPDLWARTAHVLLPRDYCLLHLTGTLASDPLANVGLVGADLGYVDELLALVPGARARMAPLMLPTGQAGQLRGGLPLAGLPVFAGTMDAWTGLVGAGAAAGERAIWLSGTSEILGVASARVIPTPGVVVFPQVLDIRMQAAPTQSGGDAAAWFAASRGLTLAEMSDLVAASPRSGAVPLFLPQLEGERAPLWDASLRAAFLGVSRRSGPADLARAVYEGVAFAARWALETLEQSSGTQSPALTCGGGGFRSDPWGRIRADVTGRVLHRLEGGEPGVLGAATLAAIGAGIFGSFNEAFGALARFDATFTPDPRRHAAYSPLFEHYKASIAALTGPGAEAARLSAAVP